MLRFWNGCKAPEVAVVIFALASAASSGCGRVGGYPDATVTSPLGREGVCVACRKTIPSVTTSNLVTFSGNQFIVCNEACARQAEAVTEHSHSH